MWRELLLKKYKTFLQGGYFCFSGLGFISAPAVMPKCKKKKFSEKYKKYFLFIYLFIFLFAFFSGMGLEIAPGGCF